MPQNGTISARSGLLSKAQDAFMNTRAGRRTSEVTDFLNKIGVGDISSGSPVKAAVPAFEKLVSQGLLKKAKNLFAKEGGFFTDKAGDIYDLGPLGEMSSDKFHEYLGTHLGVLHKAGLTKKYNMTDALYDNDLMRIRRWPDYSELEMTKMPSDIQMQQLKDMFANDKITKGKYADQTYVDLYNKDNYKLFGGNIRGIDKLVDHITNFFKK